MIHNNITENILLLLRENNVKFEAYEHEPAHTSEEAARIRNTDLSLGAKALIFIADKKPILVVCPGDKKVDTKAFKILFEVKDMVLAAPEKVTELTTLKIGSIPPIGKALNIKSYFDVSFRQKDDVVFNAASLTFSIKMKALDLIKIEEPTFGDFAK